MINKIQAARLVKPSIPDKPLNCPKCSAVCVVPCNNGFRCNQCGEQFAIKQGTKTSVSRAEALMKAMR